jgi:hypothetical protein
MDLWHIQSCRDENSVLAKSTPMRQKRLSQSGRGEFWWVVSRVHRKGTFVAGSPDGGLAYPHKVGLASHIRHGNFGEVCPLAWLICSASI